MLDKDDNRVPLQTVAASKGKETLGVILAPDGNCEDAMEEMCKKAKTWKAHMKAGHLPPSLAWQAASTKILKSLEYPLPALTLTREQCNKIMGIVKEGLLPKAHLSKNFPHAALYGPKEEGGLELPHLYITQGLMHIDKFVQHINSDSITGKLIRVSIEMAQLELGIGRDIFSLPYQKFHFLVQEGWIKSIWRFTHEHNITIRNRVTHLPLPQREHDLFLMEAFQDQGYSHAELQILNNCRKYLRVLTLSDIMTGTGDTFTEHYLCRREPQQRNRFIWPRQSQPSTAMIKLWKKALRKTFGLLAGTTSYKLGRWLNNVKEGWSWYFKPSTKTVYKHTPQGWQMWQYENNQSRHGQNCKYKYYAACITTPTNLQKATVKVLPGNRVILTGHAECLQDNRTTHSSRIETRHINATTVENTLDIPQFKHAFSNGNLRAVCDGSYFPTEKVGAAAWVIEEPITETLYSGSMPTVGEADIQTPCRSELMGLYYLLVKLLDLCKQHDIQARRITVHCDGLSAIQSIERQASRYSSGKNFDVINAIIAITKNLPIMITYKHVKGHQDMGSAYNTLSRLAQLNILVDRP